MFLRSWITSLIWKVVGTFRSLSRCTWVIWKPNFETIAGQLSVSTSLRYEKRFKRYIVSYLFALCLDCSASNQLWQLLYTSWAELWLWFFEWLDVDGVLLKSYGTIEAGTRSQGGTPEGKDGIFPSMLLAKRMMVWFYNGRMMYAEMYEGKYFDLIYG